MRGRALTLALALFLASGCTHIRLPAIDPSGESILLPPPAYTTLVHPGGGHAGGGHAGSGPAGSGRLGGWSCFPEPAFKDVPAPPPCSPAKAPCGPAAAAPARPPHHRLAHEGLHSRRNIPGRIQITPAQLISPIGSEVVLLAGLCGDHGYFVARQPIEWMLSQDSVGHFVDAGDEDHSWLHCISRKQTGKLSSNFVITQSSHKEKLVTRGTPAPTDDVVVAKGQSWVTVTSPTEGTSYVTILAPNAENWDKRRQTARIHWVDAQWLFPPPANAPAGEPHLLSTRVTRSNGESLSFPWRVRYEIAGGAPAVLGQGRETVAEVPTDESGLASIPLLPQTPDPGVTQVRIQIVRPAADESPRLVVGEGQTTISWSAAGLAVRLTGPAQALVGSAVTYRAEISNPGDIVSRDVLVTANVPPRLSFVGSNMQPEIYGNRLNWRIGDLQPRSTRVLEINCRADREGDIRFVVNAQTAAGRKAEGFVATSLFAPSLAVRMRAEPETVEVGGQVVFEMEVENTGTQPLNRVALTDRFDEGLEHVSGERSPISRELAQLGPGQTQTVRLTFVVRRAGSLCNQLDARTTTGQTSSARACVTATPPAAPPPPQVSLELDAPPERPAGEVAEVRVTVRNTGRSALSNVRIGVAFRNPPLEPQQASPEHRRAPGELFWILPELPAGQEATRQVNFLGRTAASAGIRATVTSQQGAAAEEAATIEVKDAAGGGGRTQPAATPEAAAPPPARGQLSLSIRDTDEGIRVGAQTKYVITIRNERNVSDSRIGLSVVIPPGLEFVALSGALPLPAQRTADGVRVGIQPINEIRANETLPPIEIEVRARTPGVHRVRAEATSRLSLEPVVDVEETTVNAG